MVVIDAAVVEARTKAQQVRDDKAAERLARASELQQERDKALAERDQALADAQTERTGAIAEHEQELLRLRQEEKSDDDWQRADVCGADGLGLRQNWAVTALPQGWDGLKSILQTAAVSWRVSYLDPLCDSERR